ncbi:MAG: GNAT family N-acetyltransferase [Gaiellaceae bacterium]
MTYRKAEIRPFRSEDEALLFGLASLARGADERTLAVLEEETVFVAEVEGAAAGYVALDLGEEGCRVDQLFVSPEHEAEGVGRQLIEFAEGYAIFRGARALRVVVEGGNERAESFYRGRGFVPVGEGLLELVLPQR